MRIFAAIAIAVLAIASIVEGAIIVRLSSRLDALAEQVAATPVTGPDLGVAAARAVAARAAAPPSAPVPLPRLVAQPEGTPTPATATLGEALATSEGRQHLKTAMEVLREEDRKRNQLERATRRIEREKEHIQNLVKVLGLGPDEQNKLGHIAANLHSARQRVLTDMQAGAKTAEQADDEIDNLEDEAERSVNALLGEQRMRQYRESRRNRRRGSDAAGGAPGGSLPAAAPAQ